MLRFSCRMPTTWLVTACECVPHRQVLDHRALRATQNAVQESLRRWYWAQVDRQGCVQCESTCDASVPRRPDAAAAAAALPRLVSESIDLQAAKLDGKEPKKKQATAKADRARKAPSIQRNAPSAAVAIAKRRLTDRSKEIREKPAKARGGCSTPPSPAVSSVNLSKGKRGGYSSRAVALVGHAAAAVGKSSVPCVETEHGSGDGSSASAGRGTIRAMFHKLRMP